MKYMILTYGSQQDYDGLAGRSAPGAPAWTAEEFAALGTFMQSFSKELADSGELVETRGLAAPVHTRKVVLQEGVPVVTDGPYAETQEVLAGYWIVECDSYDRATAYPRFPSSAPSRSSNASSASLVSCRQTTSGCRSSSHGSSRGTRCLAELTFQVATRTGPTVAGPRATVGSLCR